MPKHLASLEAQNYAKVHLWHIKLMRVTFALSTSVVMQAFAMSDTLRSLSNKVRLSLSCNTLCKCSAVLFGHVPISILSKMLFGHSGSAEKAKQSQAMDANAQVSALSPTVT